MIICLEGLSGTGKTSVAKGLSSALGYRYLSTPPVSLRKKLISIDQNLTSEEAFWSSLLWCSICTCNAISFGGSKVVIDRYIYSTMVYHKKMYEKYKYIVDSIDVLEPDLLILLHADASVRERRIDSRGDYIGEGNIRRKRIIASEDENMFSDIEGKNNCVKIDTSSRTVNSVIDEIVHMTVNP